MKNTFLKTIGTAALAFLMLAMFAQISVSAQDVNIEEKSDQQREGGFSQAPGNARGLEGSWNALVIFRNCQTGAAVSPPFPAMNTFMRGGTMQEFGVASGMFRSQGHGVWKHEGGLQYSRAFQFFRFNPDGSYSEKVIARSQIELRSDNTYVATSTNEFFDTNGNLLRRGCATETGTRFE